MNDEFVDDGEIETDGEDFHNRVNNKRLHDGEDQQPCSSRKKTRLEEVIESYEEQMQGICSDLDGQINRKCISSKRGRKDTYVEEFPVLEEDGAELVHFVNETKKRKNAKNKSEKKKLEVSGKKDYTNFFPVSTQRCFNVVSTLF